MANITRRTIVKSIGLSAGASFLSFPLVSGNTKRQPSPNHKLKVIVVGAHPDDPETICGGTMALYAAMGQEVVSVYLTRGEAGIEGTSHDAAAKIRTEEATQACRILKVRPEFLSQVDGSCEITPARYSEMIGFLKKEAPDIVFTHWPIDSHRDHRICSSLVTDAWFNAEKKFSLYYCEAMTGAQTQNFVPTDYVDITHVVKQKHDACFSHKSQKLDFDYAMYHGRMETFRGMEHRCEFAEAFVHHWPSVKGILP